MAGISVITVVGRW